MPAPEFQDVRRGKMLHWLFWGGVGLAPLAMLILLFGQSNATLRIAVILSVLTVVALAVSIAMRPSVELLRVDIEHRVLDEVERVRLRAREDITTAARNTHRVLSDKIQVLTDTVESLRVQIDELRDSGMLAAPAPAPALSHAVAPGNQPGVVRRTETVHVTRRTTTVDAGDDDSRGTVYGSKAAVEGEWRHSDNEREDDRWDGAGGRWAAMRADDRGRELRLGERRASVRSDGRGTEYRVEDRWAALRRDDPVSGEGYGEADWEATFRSLSNKDGAPGGLAGGRTTDRPALPPSRGESPDRYTERDDRDREPVRARGGDRSRERGRDDYDDDRRHDDDRRYDDRRRDDRRYEDDHRYDDRRRGDGRYDGDGRHEDDRRYADDRRYDSDGRHEDDRRYDERRHDDGDRDRGRRRDHDDRDRDYDRSERYAPRPREGHRSEYDR
jgi:hypothetical protein